MKVKRTAVCLRPAAIGEFVRLGAEDEADGGGLGAIVHFGSGAVGVDIPDLLQGHAGGAGAIEAAASALTLANGVIPPTVNYTKPGPLCDLDVVPNAARTQQVEACLSNSFAFGGLNAVLALRKFA
jgi:nodulation protein E